jgi:hypothetical protein
MTAGGSIEGRVLLPGGRDPAGTIVGASRGRRLPADPARGRGRLVPLRSLMPGDGT